MSPQPTPTQKYVTATDWVYQELRKRIQQRLYAPNSFLPAERELAEELGVGRRQVRNALERLVTERLLERQHGRGTRVLADPDQPKGAAVALLYPILTSVSWGAEFCPQFDGVLRALAARGYSCEHFPFTATPDGRLQIHVGNETISCRKLLDLLERFKGMISIELNYGDQTELALALEQRHAPVVVVNLEQDAPVSATCVNHAGVTRKAVDILASFGHRRIAFLTRDPQMGFYQKSLRGYREGLEAAGLPLDDSLIAVLPSAVNTNDRLATYRIIRPILERPDRPTAVVAARDWMAGVVCEVLGDLKLSVGYDVSVIGFDDLSWPCKTPFLTTFREPSVEMAAAAVEMLEDRILHGWRPVEQRVIDAPLVLRSSAGLAVRPADILCRQNA